MELLDRHADAREFLAYYLNLRKARLASAEQTNAELLTDLGVLHGSSLEWLEPAYRDSVKREAAFTLLWVIRRLEDFQLSRLCEVMEPSLEWIASQDDRAVAEFCWGLRTRSLRTPTDILERWGRLRGAMSRDYLDLAVTLNNEAEAMHRWPEERWAIASWDRDSQIYLGSLDHPSCLVRAVGAKGTGRLLWGLKKNTTLAAPPVSELLTQIGQREKVTPGVAGPFMEGIWWGDDDAELLPEFDSRSWLLDTLGNSRREPSVPDCQTLEFYAHEFFSADGPAIEELLRMGRRSLAVYTATQSPEYVGQLRDVLNRMAASDDLEVAQAIQTYLEEPSHHRGVGYLTDDPFGIYTYS
jgi:hypothetical protein